jgi:hypothetical protein
VKNAYERFFRGGETRKFGESTDIEARESIKPCELKLVTAVNLFKSMFIEVSGNVYVIEKI